MVHFRNRGCTRPRPPAFEERQGLDFADHDDRAEGSRSKADPSKGRLTTILSGFRTTLAPVAARATLQAHPELQLLVLSLNVQRMDFPDGSVGAIADPAGMSGSPIWLLQEDELKCAGILIEHHRSKKLLVATDIAVGLHLIEMAAARFPPDIADSNRQY